MKAESPEPESLGDVLEEFRPRLRRMVSLRLDPRLRRRVDSSDVLQEAFVDVTKRFHEYEADPRGPFFLWVRRMTAQKLAEFHRRHLDAEKRDVRREVLGPDYPEATSETLARVLVDSSASPSELVTQEEEEERLRVGLEGMQPIDREILVLHYFERLTLKECALVLDVSESAAKMRHLKATERLHRLLSARQAFAEGEPS